MHGIWQLARQSLMTESRRKGAHVIRFGLVAVLYMALTQASLSVSGAAGLPLFHTQLLITAFYLTMNTVFGFSQVISEEKEEETLGLLRLADISPLSIILGKMAGRLTDASLLLILQFPFTIVALTLGGISWVQIIAAYVALGTYLWLLATLGLVASVVQPTGGAAARWTAIPIAIYVIPPCLAWLDPIRWAVVTDVYRLFSLPMRLTDVTVSDFNESWWCSAVGFGLVMGLIFVGWAWWVFDRPLRPERPRVEQRPRSAQRMSMRAWERPVVWREFEFLTGGTRWLVMRTAAHLSIVLVMLVTSSHFGFAFAWSSIFAGLYGLLDGSWLVSRLFRDEIHDRTWSALVQSPNTIPQLVLDKFSGWLLGVTPSIVFPYVWIVLTLMAHPNSRMDMAIELLIGSVTVGLSVLAYLHLLALMTLYYGWQATPLTLTISFAAGWMYVVTMFTYRWGLEARCFMDLFTCMVLVATMAGLQALIVRRLRTLAEIA